MALGLLTGSKKSRRNKGNSNAKFAITPHRRSKVMVEQFTSNVKSTYKWPTSIEEVKACV
jgi:hypothetical protein